MKKNISTILLLIVLLSVSCFAERYSFKHITMDMGLSHNQINGIYRDCDGFMWFSTANGLTRYDGYEMRIFMHTSDTTSMADNYVAWVTDLNDSVMIGKNRDNYFFFDKHTEKFSSANSYFSSFGVPYNISNIFVDSEADVWLFCDNSIYIYSSAQKKMLTPSCGIDINVGATITSFYERNRTIYLMCNNGVMLMIPISDKCEPQKYVRKQTPVGNGSHNIFIDSDGDYWIYTNEGLWYYRSETKNWCRCTSELSSPIRVPAFVINGIAEDVKHRIWITSNHGGVSVIDKIAHSSTLLQSNKNDVRSLITNSLSCVYCDASGTVWLGSVRSGISVYNESVFKFDINELTTNGVPSDFIPQINAIEEDRQGGLWYGSNGSGLLHLTRNGQATLYRHSLSNPTSIPNDIIVDLLADSKGRLWIGSFLGGLSYFDGSAFHSFKGKNGYPASVGAENVWAIAEDDKHNIWVGSLGNGVAMCNAENGQWTEYTEKNSTLPSNYISQIVTTDDGKIFVATSYGVAQYNEKRGFVRVGDQLPTVTTNVNDIYVDSRGLLWVGSDNGLTVLNSSTFEQVAYFDTKVGLQHNIITGIVEDTDRNMWVTTTCGIANIVVNPNPRTNEYAFMVYSYDEHDGMMRGAMNVRAIKRTSYGEIIVGGNYGVAHFYPNKIKYNKEVPTITFTKLAVLDNEVGIGQEVNGRTILSQAMPYTKNIELDYTDNMFTISFSTLSSVLPEKVTYSYMLEGFSNKWINAHGNSATYTNLAPGQYTLKVKASNCDGFSSINEAKLHITILPPWWKTNVAYLCYIIILIMLITLVIVIVRNREREKYNLSRLEAEIEKKTEIDELKLRFFTNVSHELRTPLSLIISPLEALIEQTTDSTIKSKLEMMHRNATRLLNIVNQLLDLRKTDSNAMQLNLSEGDIVSFTKQQVDDFASLSERNIKFSFSSSEDAVYTEFDRDKTSKMVSNILSNALKYTPDGGSITTTIALSADKHSVQISIADTGIGVPDEHKPHIFDRFYQVPQANSSNGGSGIGLHMVKEFATMHNGTVAVADNSGGGSVFTITLPLRTAEHNQAEMSEDAEQLVEERKSIIVVDDNADFRTLLTDILSDEFDVIQAKNGEEAFAEIVRLQPNIIISDVMMPVMDGNELCKKVKTDVRTSHIPFVMLTAKTAEEHRIEGLSNGADDYISKPFNPQILKLRIAKLIELGIRRHEKFKQQIEPEPSEITITPLDEKLIQKAIKYVEDNIASPDLSVEELSRYLGMSRVHLYKKLLSITGHSPIEFIRIIRLKRAAQMLKDKQQNVSDVAYAVGFNNPKYFSKYFKEEFGVLPSVYQNNTDGVTSNFEL